MSDILLKSIHFPQLDARYIVGDDTLSEEGAAADAKETGDALALKADKTDTYTKEQVDDKVGDAKTELEEAIEDLEERKAETGGYYETFTSGQANQLIATEAVTDTEPYNYRKTGGPNDVGDRAYDTLVGGSVVWNQLVKNGNFASVGTWSLEGYGNYTVANNMATVTLTAANSSARFQQPTSLVKGHKYFATATMKAEYKTNYHITFQTGSSGATIASKYAVEADTWATVCGIREVVDADLTSRVIRFYFGSANASVGDKIYVKNCMLIDLTAAVTPLIADYIYSLEQTTAGAGVAWFRKYFPKEYHAYCEPHFEHVQTSAKETVGFNQWDEETANGYWDRNTGEWTASGNWVSCKNYIPCLPNTGYYFNMGQVSSGSLGVICYYDYDKNFISSNAGVSWGNTVNTTPNNAYYMTFYANQNYFANDICINIHGDRDGEYEAYKKRTYPLDSSLTLRGILKLDSANRPYFDGDIYRHDGSGTRRYALADAGTLNWTYNSTYNYFGVLMNQEGSKKALGASNFLLPGYVDVGVKTDAEMESVPNYSIAANSITGAWIKLKNTNYTSVASFKSAMSGVYLLFELLTPEPFTAEPFQSPMVVDPLGTEEFVDYGVEQGDRDVAIPVGHNSEYPADLRGKLQHLPSLSTSGDGRYVVVQTGNQMTLSPDTSLGLIAALEARVAALEGGNG